MPFLDLAAAYDELRPAVDAAYARVMASGRWILGPEVEAFEDAFAAHVGVRHAVGVGSGLDALEIALRARGIGPGDEVVVPAHTFVATWLAVSRTGAVPVGADVDPATLLLDPDAAASAIGPRTAAIVPVHLYGRTVAPDPLAALASRHGLAVVEDAAQAHGARHGDRRSGALGDAGAFSFYPGKNLGAFGDGGALTTDDDDLAARARRLRNYGSVERYRHDEVAGNSRLDPLQAAFLAARLPLLDAWNARRAAIAARYREGLRDVPDLVLPPADDPGTVGAWHLFAVRHPHRDALRAHLDARGVDTLVHYPVVPHRTGAYASTPSGAGSFPVAEAAAATLLSLPIGPHLTATQADRVIDAVRSFVPPSRAARPAVAPAEVAPVAARIGATPAPSAVRSDDAPPPADEPWRCVFNRTAFHRLNVTGDDRILVLDHVEDGRTVGSLTGVVRDGTLTCGHSAPFGGIDLARPRETAERIASTVDGVLAAACDHGVRDVVVSGRPAPYGDNEAGAQFALLNRGFTVERADLAYVVDLTHVADADAYVAGLRSPARRALRHTVDGPWTFRAVDDERDWRAAHALLAANRAARGRRLALDADYVLRARAALPGVLRTFVLAHDGAPCAAALVYAAAPGAWYVVAWGDALHELPRSPMNVLALRVVQAALAAGVRIVDLGVSSVPDGAALAVDPGLARFKQSIGARPHPRLVLRSPPIG
ncbi:MAG: DegT/DnrJ/EryC1/StrS family aminotransferase [Solirubrobacteraceae bacterium]|nr:DegT/DnrJ/EryC1/StrS family aminotransferase [Solirubrobacteraceae bacterium]